MFVFKPANSAMRYGSQETKPKEWIKPFGVTSNRTKVSWYRYIKNRVFNILVYSLRIRIFAENLDRNASLSWFLRDLRRLPDLKHTKYFLLCMWRASHIVKKYYSKCRMGQACPELAEWTKQTYQNYNFNFLSHRFTRMKHGFLINKTIKFHLFASKIYE